MPKRNDIKKIMVIGSGPIVIGQAGSLTMPAVRPARLCARKAMRLF